MKIPNTSDVVAQESVIATVADEDRRILVARRLRLVSRHNRLIDEGRDEDEWWKIWTIYGPTMSTPQFLHCQAGYQILCGGFVARWLAKPGKSGRIDSSRLLL